MPNNAPAGRVFAPEPLSEADTAVSARDALPPAVAAALDEEYERHRDALAALYAEVRAEVFPPPALVPAPDGGPRLARRSVALPDARQATPQAERRGETLPLSALLPAALLTYPQAAARLGISRRALERLVAAERLRPVRVSARCIRFHPDALDAFAASSARPAKTRPASARTSNRGGKR